MICRKCATAAQENRIRFNLGQDMRRKHPKNCGCACMHKPIEKWEKQFSVPEPLHEARKIEDTKPL